jgi:malonyl-CoA/methylmalonyl-CoA synthetase
MSTSCLLFERAEGHGEQTAVIDAGGGFSYRRLLDTSASIGSALLDGARDLKESRIAYLVPPGFQHVAVQWGIWRAGGVAVPLATQHPTPELEYVLGDAEVSCVIAHPDFHAKLRQFVDTNSLRLISSLDIPAPNVLPADPARMPTVDLTRRAMILYTSGTTGKSKGVVTTHANIQAQVETLVEAWQWTREDHILHVLPLHHIHGIVNVLTCATWAGAKCEMLPRFNAHEVWERISRGDLTLLMAVPTIYAKLIAAWSEADPHRQQAMSAGCARMRLMVSGSAALPVATLEQWRSTSGQVLLERYGMTEIGMALSNPLHGRRVPGHVGTPLPRVEVRLVDEDGNPVTPATPGEIEVRGPGVFLEYWQQPEATKAAFREGWFRTGDMAVVEEGSYRILGRKSVDIIKSGGYKVSALEIEEILRTHPHIRECAVVGVEDPEWGQRVSAGLVLEDNCSLTLASLRSWAKQHLAAYKVPTQMLKLEELPRNAMGKVHKPTLAEMFR